MVKMGGEHMPGEVKCRVPCISRIQDEWYKGRSKTDRKKAKVRAKLERKKKNGGKGNRVIR